MARPATDTQGAYAIARSWISLRLLQSRSARWRQAEQTEELSLRQRSRKVQGGVVDYLVEEAALRLQQRIDPFLDGVQAGIPVNHDGVDLAHAMRPRGRLRLDRRVPPAIEIKDVGGRLQIQPHSTRSQREQKRFVLRPRHKPRNHLGAPLR